MFSFNSKDVCTKMHTVWLLSQEKHIKDHDGHMTSSFCFSVEVELGCIFICKDMNAT